MIRLYVRVWVKSCAWQENSLYNLIMRLSKYGSYLDHCFRAADLQNLPTSFASIGQRQIYNFSKLWKLQFESYKS